MIEIQNLIVQTEKREILHDINVLFDNNEMIFLLEKMVLEKQHY